MESCGIMIGIITLLLAETVEFFRYLQRRKHGRK